MQRQERSQWKGDAIDLVIRMKFISMDLALIFGEIRDRKIINLARNYCGFCSNRILHYFPMLVS